jgi:hypothetical protein
VPFRVGPDPFAAGQHRGIEILTRARTPVRAACAGRIGFAGRVAAQGPTVAETCGALTATYLHLGTLGVRPGAHVDSGQRIGTVGAGGGSRGPRLYFGVRRTSRRFGYLDPLALLPPPMGAPRRPVVSPARRRVPIAAPARGPGGAPAPGPAPALRLVPARRPRSRPHPAPGGALAARLGLLLAGLALPSWGGALIATRGRARRARTRTALARRAA